MGKKIISFSLWGDKNAYYYGMLENILRRDKLYPNWTIRIYYGEGKLISKFIPIFEQFENVECINMLEFNKEYWGKSQTARNMMWRFLPCFEDKEEVEVVIFRDNDSVFTMREVKAVNEWLKSDKVFHIMKDDPRQGGTILGGMWGYKNDNSLLLFKDKMINYPSFEKNKGVDMFFIKDVVNPIALKSAMVHLGNNAKIDLKNNKFIKINEFKPYKHKDFVGRPNFDTPLAFKHLNEKPHKLSKKPWGQAFSKKINTILEIPSKIYKK